MLTIDYSGYKTWMTCPWLWYERYVNGLRKRRLGQQDNALTLGSLLHAGIEVYRRYHKVEIPATVVMECDPTPECFANAMSLLTNYIQAHPMEPWELELMEEALIFPISNSLQGLAKLDHLFYVSEPTTIPNGPMGSLTLEEGWWIRDYKTRDAGGKRENYLMSWNANMQANFQMLAANHYISQHSTLHREVRGMLVDVIEKPRIYVPQRTCKACKNKWEYGAWAAQQDGTFMCPWCSNYQELDPPKRDPGYCAPPTMYAIMVQRTPSQLETAYNEINQVAVAMDAMVHYKNPTLVAPNRDKCIDSIYGPCEFYQPHTFEQAPLDTGLFEIYDPIAYQRAQQVQGGL